MTVPDYQTLMLPLLRCISDGREHTLSETIEVLSREFNLSLSDLAEKSPSGKQSKFSNRIGWGRTYLKKAGLLETPRVGVVKITRIGLGVLKANPKEIDRKFLMQFPEFVEFQKHVPERTPNEGGKEVGTPTEKLEDAYEVLRAELITELLYIIKSSPPKFFEKLVLELLDEMGYGRPEHVGRSGDGGIDGTIYEDELGLDVIHIQAKRWDEGTVGRKEVQAFAGSLEGQRARKGVFITTSQFSQEALDYVKGIEKRIVLVDGQKLAELMIENDIGVKLENSYDVKKVDATYFSEG